ncbi:polysaccharide biosynthesis tyrosine autokinase [Prosthecobacter sp.]|jgi:capsular exopolysaccharide synthesis family protein|uniref:polysaccharide biosynthesis tyrosine autokinase n=1 Tax=Prosthecobacter sp. TaxID=1965333 RepID=UPI0037CCAE33
MAQNQKTAQGAIALDWNGIISIVLSYENYWRLMILLFITGLLSALIVYVYARPSYESTALIRVSQYLDSSQLARGGAADFQLVRSSIGYELESEVLQLEAAKSLGWTDEKTTYYDLRNNLVPVVRASFLDQYNLELSVSAYNPVVVREFAKALAEVYETNKVKLRNEYRDKAIKRYIDEITDVRKKLSTQLDTRLKFEEESALAGAQIELERLSNVPVELVRLRYRTEEMERIREVLEKRQAALGVIGQLALLTSLPAAPASADPLKSGSIVRNSGSMGPFNFTNPAQGKIVTQVVVQPDMVEGLEPWQALEKRKRVLEEKTRITRAKFLEGHPEMLKLKDELYEVSSALDLELEVARKAFELEYARSKEQLLELEAKMPDYHKATKSFDDKKMGYDLMKKGQLAWDNAYEQLSKQIEGLQLTTDVGSVNLEFRGFVNIRSDLPVSPSRYQLGIIGCLLGIGLAGGVPFLFTKLDTSITSLSEFERGLGLNGIGIVPMADPEVLSQMNRSNSVGSVVPNTLLENFRLIRSSIIINQGAKDNARVILVTSARPGEGKTTLATNIGWAFSSMGDKTLVIDCDLRRGRVHQVGGVPNDLGLTNLLTNNAKLEDCIQQSTADNLWLITRGPVISGTTELLNAKVFSNLLDELKGRFDRIVIDSPPVLGLSETAFLQKYADGVVLVIKSGATSRGDVKDAFNLIGKLGAHFYGFVLNQVDFSKRANHYQYYYYSSTYYEANWEEEKSLSLETPSSDSRAP